MLLMSALMVGFTTVVMSDQRYRGIDRDRSQAFYAAHAGLEKLTARSEQPVLHERGADAGAAEHADGECRRTWRPRASASSLRTTIHRLHASQTARPRTHVVTGMVASGPYQGLIALRRATSSNSTARTRTGGEVHLRSQRRNGGDSGVSVRHVLGRRSELLRRSELRTSAAAFTPTATCSSRTALRATARA